MKMALGGRWSVVAALLALSVFCAPAPALRAQEPAPVAPRGLSRQFVGQGFDKCEIASFEALQTWSTQSPYRALNLYIGGAGRACSNQALSASLVAELSQIGWKFIPTWVGPQAPCYMGFKPFMSIDPAIAYDQGVAEANAAVEVALGLGLTLADGSGTIVYYDVERYDSDNMACNEAVKSFVSGWIGRLHGRGNLAGVYGNGPTLNGLAGSAVVPDAIWAARWIYSVYTPEATVWDVPGLPNDLWANHRRIRQYTGGHTETWGGVALNIDCDVIDGLVADVSAQSSAHVLHLPLVLTR